eukprot:COSAG02_NODE_26307_length_635_cov_2.694030_1_plen_44_part_10
MVSQALPLPRLEAQQAGVVVGSEYENSRHSNEYIYRMALALPHT